MHRRLDWDLCVCDTERNGGTRKVRSVGCSGVGWGEVRVAEGWFAHRCIRMFETLAQLLVEEIRNFKNI
jgi:hypothetical protein